MTRMEYIQSCSEQGLAKILCKVIEKAFNNYEDDHNVAIRFCDYCPATNYCHKDHAGFIDWLGKEMELK